LDNLAIGFSIYNCDHLRERMGRRFFETEHVFASTKAFINRREATLRFRGPPGGYLIVPSTFDAGEEAEFLLRVFANGPIQWRVCKIPTSFQSPDRDSIPRSIFDPEIIPGSCHSYDFHLFPRLFIDYWWQTTSMSEYE
uniref:Calpain_III domain-containing protein n=1 Tax=Anisakis simplex TaxID=6269 RepID=A0A0M3JIV4_ANISI